MSQPWQPGRYDQRAHQQRIQPPPQYPAPYAPQGYGQLQPQYRPPGAPKSVGVAMVLSAFFPGAGSMYSENISTGIVILLMWLASLALSVILVGLFGVAVAWTWGLMSAYADARRWNAAHGIAS